MSLPRWRSGKESTCNAGNARDVGSIPGLGRFPGEGNGNPFQYSCLENSMDRRAQWEHACEVSLRQPGHRPSLLLLSGQIESSVLCVGHHPLGSTGVPSHQGRVLCPCGSASPQHLRGHSLLALHAVAVHVPFPLHVEAREGLPVLIHTPAETPLPALGRAALQAEHRLNEP